MEQFAVCFLCTLAHVPSLVLRYVPFKTKISDKKRNALLVMYTIALLVNFAIYWILIQQNKLTIGFYKINLILFCMVMAGINMIVIKRYAREHLFTFGLVSVLVLILSSCAAFVADFIGYENLYQGLIYANVILIATFAGSYYFLRKLMINTVAPFLNIDGNDYWNTIWFVPIAMFLASLLAVPMDSYVNTLPHVISKILICVATIFICQNIAKDYKRISESKQLYRIMEEQKQYYQTLSQKVKLEREARHNYKHHLTVMQNFLDNGNVDMLHEYISQFVANQPKEINVPYSGNAAVDGILLYYAQLAETKGIELELQCHFPEHGNIDLDLCNLIGNALDNAVTAAERCDGNKWIHIASEIKSGMILITVSNSFDGLVNQQDNRILSRKRQMKEGIGIKTMTLICKKYGGKSDFSWEGSEFHASFMLMQSTP